MSAKELKKNSHSRNLAPPSPLFALDLRFIKHWPPVDMDSPPNWTPAHRYRFETAPTSSSLHSLSEAVLGDIAKYLPGGDLYSLWKLIYHATNARTMLNRATNWLYITERDILRLSSPFVTGLTELQCVTILGYRANAGMDLSALPRQLKYLNIDLTCLMLADPQAAHQLNDATQVPSQVALKPLSHFFPALETLICRPHTRDGAEYAESTQGLVARFNPLPAHLTTFEIDHTCTMQILAQVTLPPSLLHLRLEFWFFCLPDPASQRGGNAIAGQVNNVPTPMPFVFPPNLKTLVFYGRSIYFRLAMLPRCLESLRFLHNSSQDCAWDWENLPRGLTRLEFLQRPFILVSCSNYPSLSHLPTTLEYVTLHEEAMNPIQGWDRHALWQHLPKLKTAGLVSGAPSSDWPSQEEALHVFHRVPHPAIHLKEMDLNPSLIPKTMTNFFFEDEILPEHNKAPRVLSALPASTSSLSMNIPFYQQMLIDGHLALLSLSCLTELRLRLKSGGEASLLVIDAPLPRTLSLLKIEGLCIFKHPLPSGLRTLKCCAEGFENADALRSFLPPHLTRLCLWEDRTWEYKRRQHEYKPTISCEYQTSEVLLPKPIWTWPAWSRPLQGPPNTAIDTAAQLLPFSLIHVSLFPRDDAAPDFQAFLQSVLRLRLSTLVLHRQWTNSSDDQPQEEPMKWHQHNPLPWPLPPSLTEFDIRLVWLPK